MNTAKRRRITMKLKHPNPLFEKWLTDWRDKAKENNSKMQFCFSSALQSLKKYPLPLETGQDCKILKGFGERLCDMLDEKLKKHKNQQHLNPDETILPLSNKYENEISPKAKKKITSRVNNQLGNNSTSKSEVPEYIPQIGSGAFAILAILYEKSLEENYPGFLTKIEIIRHGQHLAEHSFTKPEPQTRYTAWSSMKTLLTKELVHKKGNPAKFSLTDCGIILAKKLYEHNYKNNIKEKLPSVDSSISISNEIITKKVENIIQIEEHFPRTAKCHESRKILIEKYSSSASTSTETSSQSQESVIFAPYSFDIILYVDTQETSGKAEVVDDPLLAELNRLHVKYEVNHLKLGDYTWICRERQTKKELILPFIVERKRMDDLCSSIKDGRYHEQKFRLKKCGLKNVTYLIESYGQNDRHLGLPLTTLYQAATNTAIQDGFSIKFTDSLRSTADYLVCFTNLLINKFKSKTILCCSKEDIQEVSVNDDLISLMSFKEFNQTSSKSKDLFVRDLFVRMLIQIKGMSVEKALAIVEKFHTPALLFEEYESLSSLNGEQLVSNIEFGKLRKTIGPTLSKTLYQFFTSKTF